MNEENTGHYLKSLHKELGDVIDIMINRIETMKPETRNQKPET